MFRTEKEMKKEVKRIAKFLRSVKRNIPSDYKHEYVGYILCLKEPISQEDFNKLEKMCQKRKIEVSHMDENSDTIQGLGNYWFKLRVWPK